MSKTTRKLKRAGLQSEAVKPLPSVRGSDGAPSPVARVQPEAAKPQTSVRGSNGPVSSTARQPEAVKPQTIATQLVAAAPVKAPAPRTNRVCLEFVQPGAREVLVAGSFNGWKPERTPLWHRGNGHWVGDLAVGAGRHEYLFVVDGQWLPDPNAKESVQNPFGGKNSVLMVSE